MERAQTYHGRGYSIRTIVTGPLDNNVYLIHDDASGSALVIDAADDPASIVAMASGATVLAIATTHGHADHLGAAEDVARTLGVPILLHEADLSLSGLADVHTLEPGLMPVGTTAVDIVHTPGHTPGSVCLRLEDHVLTGDTLFPGGPGATRFPYSSFPQIIESVETHLLSLDDGTIILPGHGDPTTVALERPKLPEWITRGW